MSYEGYIQELCANGHLSEEPESYCDYEVGARCLVCGAEIVWKNSVDDTNGDACGAVPMKMLEISPEKVEETKEEVDGRWVVSIRRTVAVYRIPSRAETKLLRSWWDGDVCRFIESGREVDPGGNK